MRSGIRRFLVIFLGLCGGGLLAGEPANLAALIRKLGSGRFADREAAGRALENLGAKAVPALEKEKDNPNSEVRGRARMLLGQIQKNIESHRYVRAFQFKAIPAKNSSTIQLAITAQPPITLQELLSCRIEAALTGEGQNLAALLNPQTQKADPHSVPIVLPAGKWKSFKEIRGTIAARIQTNISLEVPDILKAAGKSARGQSAEAIKILAVREGQAEDVVDVHLQVENFEPEDNDKLPPAMRVRPGVIVMLGPEDIVANRLNLLDAKGAPCRRLSYNSKFLPGKQVLDMRLLYRPPPGPVGPLRLLYEHQRSVVVEIPFALRNVPLQ